MILAIMKKIFLTLLCCMILGMTGCQPTKTTTFITNTTTPTKTQEKYPGLIGDRVTCLAVDKDNVVWIGNYNQIAAYSGGAFQLYDRLSDNIPSSNIRKIFVDSSNIKWFGNYSGNVFSFDNKKWTFLPDPGLGPINDIRQDETGRVWVAAYDGICNYQDGQIRDVFRSTGYTFNIVPSAINGVLAIGPGTVLKYNGEKFVDITETLGNPYINDIAFDDTHDVIYLSLGNKEHFTAGLYTLENGELQSVPYQLTEDRKAWMYLYRLDEKETLWASNGKVIAKLTGQGWESVSLNTPMPNSTAFTDMAIDRKGCIWFGGYQFRNTETDIVYSNGGYWPLMSYDGVKWIVYPVLSENPRLWWNSSDLYTLMDIPVASVTVSEALQNPSAFYGKKIRITGSLLIHDNGSCTPQSATIADFNGQDLGIIPIYHPELSSVIATMGIQERLMPISTGNIEFIGFLQYVNETSADLPAQMLITEIYPVTDDQQQRDTWAKQYRDYLISKEQDKKEIREVLNRWVTARGIGDVAAMQEIFHPDGSNYRNLTLGGFPGIWGRNAFGKISFDSVLITINEDKATAFLHGVRVDLTGTYFASPEFTSKYKMDISQYTSLKKDGNTWKILNDCLMCSPYTSIN